MEKIEQLGTALIRKKGVAALSFLLLAAAGVLISPLIQADGRAEYCYVKYEDRANPYELWSHRSWRTDLKIGEFENPERAAEVAQIVGCPLVLESSTTQVAFDRRR